MTLMHVRLLAGQAVNASRVRGARHTVTVVVEDRPSARLEPISSLTASTEGVGAPVLPGTRRENTGCT